MLNDFPSIYQSETERYTYVNGRVAHMNPSSYSFLTETEPVAHLDNNSSNTVSAVSSSNNSTSSSSNSEQQVEQPNSNLSYQQSITLQQHRDHNPTTSLSHNSPLSSSSHHFHHHQHQQQQQQLQQQQQHQHQQQPQHHHTEQRANYFAGEQDSNYNNSANKFSSISRSSKSSPNTSALNVKPVVDSTSTIGSISVDSTQHNSMIPTAHGSDQQIHYSLSTQKNLTESSPSSMALNFTNDPLHAGHHGQGTSNLQHHSDEIKQQSTNSFELDSASLMQTAAVGMNMWKSTMNLNHFKHPAISDHNFLPSPDLNSFSSWTHGGNLGSHHQPPNMTHHILDSQHLIGYSQHQRSLPLSNQDLVGTSLKSHSPAEQASFMLNSINHQASTSQNSSSNHQTNQIDNINLRSNHLDHSASYNLSMNDNQIYTSSRSEGRSHPNAIKPSFVVPDRSVHMSLTNNHNQLSYHNAEQASIQPTTSHQVASSSSSSSSKTEWRCSFCSEVFPLRTVYQAHLKTHSQDKGNNQSDVEKY